MKRGEDTAAAPVAIPTYAPGMRDLYPNLCWRVLGNGNRCCIRDRGHGGGVHEGVHETEPCPYCGTREEFDGHVCEEMAVDAIKRLRETLEEIAGIADDHPFPFTAQIVELAHGVLYD